MQAYELLESVSILIAAVRGKEADEAKLTIEYPEGGYELVFRAKDKEDA